MFDILVRPTHPFEMYTFFESGKMNIRVGPQHNLPLPLFSSCLFLWTKIGLLTDKGFFGKKRVAEFKIFFLNFHF